MHPSITPGTDGGVAVLQGLLAATKKVTYVAKEGSIQIGKSAPIIVRTAESVLNAIGPVFREEGLFVLTEAGEPEHETIIQKNANGYERTTYRTTLRLTVTIVSATDGSTVTSSVIGEAMNSGDKSTSAAHTVAFRIALTQMFSMPTGDPEPETADYSEEGMNQDMRPIHNAQPITKEQMIQRAESDSCSADTILAMMNDARNKGDRDLYQKLDTIGSRRFPNRQN